MFSVASKLIGSVATIPPSCSPPPQAQNLPREKTESGLRKSSGCNVAPPALLRFRIGPAVVQAFFPVVAVGPAVVEAVFRWLP